MRVHLRLLSLLTLVLAFAAPVAAQEDGAEYPQLLARFQAGDSTVDVTALRMAFTRTDAYDPYASDDTDQQRAMWGHLEGGRYEEAAQTAEALLARNWLDLAPHMVAAVAYGELGADSAAALHRVAVRGLVESIGGEEDGRTPESPMRVIEISEEYGWLNARGLRAQRQGLGGCGSSRCDSFRVRDEDGREFTLYFDVGIPYAWMRARMEERSRAGAEATP